MPPAGLAASWMSHSQHPRVTYGTSTFGGAGWSRGGSRKVAMTASRDSQMEALGAFIRSKRKLANISLRHLAEGARPSNPNLSQIERGLRKPSVRVIRLISDALNVSTETLLTQ